MMKSTTATIPLIIFLLIVGIFTFSLRRDPTHLPTEILNQPLPDFTLPSLEDTTRKLTKSDLSGKVRLINIFGSWCVACVQEHPTLMAIAHSREVEIIGINWRDEREKARHWLTHYGNPYTDIIFDETSLLAIDLGVSGAPESFIIDHTGYIRYKHVGIITPQIWTDTLRPLIRSLQASS